MKGKFWWVEENTHLWAINRSIKIFFKIIIVMGLPDSNGKIKILKSKALCFFMLVANNQSLLALFGIPLINEEIY